MKHNVGSSDKTLRIIIGVVLISLAFFMPLTTGVWLGVIVGIILLATGLISWCPLYRLLGINTCATAKDS